MSDLGYHLVTPEAQIPGYSNPMKGLLIMKLAVRIFALSVVIAGAAAASVSSSTTHAVRSHQSATETLPVPGMRTLCPHLPAARTRADSNRTAGNRTKVLSGLQLFCLSCKGIGAILRTLIGMVEDPLCL